MSENFEVSSTKIHTQYGEFDLYCFTFGDHEEDNLLCLVSGRPGDRPIVRVQSACYTAEIFRSTDCDCHEQLTRSLEIISEGSGILIYMLCDGRGAGLQTKIQGLELGRTEGLDTAEAYDALGVERDPREYNRVSNVLDYLEVDSVRLLTNNPRKVEGLEKKDIEVEREPLEIAATEKSKQYLETKASKMGHMLDQFE
jgi:GTP cyclohydrolase II